VRVAGRADHRYRAPGGRWRDIGVRDHAGASFGAAGTRAGRAEHQAGYPDGEGERAPMNGSERQRLQEEQLKDEIDELRGELGETVESLVHKADIPARAKERGADLAEQALDRGVEVHQQMVKRGGEIGAQARDLYDKVRAQANGRSSEWRDQAV